MFIPLVVQYRHVHLSKPDIRRLFGDEKNLHVAGEIGHHGQVIYKETVDIEGKDGVIESVSILGPSRSVTQVELSQTDAFAVGIKAPTRQSGDLEKSGTCTIVGSQDSIRVPFSTIIPARHLHCSDKIAKKLRLKNRDVISLKHSERDDVVFTHVFVRVHPTFALELHLTADEAAHHWLQSGDLFELC